jgi:hypothetical protein
LILKLWTMNKEERKNVFTLCTHFNIHYNRTGKYKHIQQEIENLIGDGYTKEIWCLVTNTARALKYGALGLCIPRDFLPYKGNVQTIRHRKMISLVDKLSDSGYLVSYIGGITDWKEMDVVSSRTLFTEKYLSLWQGVDVSDEIDSVNVVEVKDRITKEIKSNKGFTGIKDIRQQMTTFNSLLSLVEIEHEGKILPIQMYKRSFIDSLTLGGRMYNTTGGVQTLSQEERAELKLNGKNVVELDFKAMHASLLYEKEWQADKESLEMWIATEWNGEYNPYGADLSFLNVDQEKIEQFRIKYNKPKYDPVRNLQKRIVMIALNAKSYPKTCANITTHYKNDYDKRDTEQENDCLYYGIEPDFDEKGELEFRSGHSVQAVAYHNSPIAKYFFKDQGVHLQYIDSEILSDVMSKLIMQGEVLLPEHDSVIVLDELEGVALQYMKDAYLKVMGSDKFCYVEKK